MGAGQWISELASIVVAASPAPARGGATARELE
jgi:hypothetical protein